MLFVVVIANRGALPKTSWVKLLAKSSSRGADNGSRMEVTAPVMVRDEITLAIYPEILRFTTTAALNHGSSGNKAAGHFSGKATYIERTPQLLAWACVVKRRSKWTIPLAPL